MSRPSPEIRALPEGDTDERNGKRADSSIAGRRDATTDRGRSPAGGPLGTGAYFRADPAAGREAAARQTGEGEAQGETGRSAGTEARWLLHDDPGSSPPGSHALGDDQGRGRRLGEDGCERDLVRLQEHRAQKDA